MNKSFTKTLLQIGLAATLISTSVTSLAQEDNSATATGTEPVQEVVITGINSPKLQRYRHMLAGLDAFEKYHDLAPNATRLEFRLRPRDETLDNSDATALSIAGTTSTITLSVSEDGTFVLPRSDAAENEDADIILNNKKKFRSLLNINVYSKDVPEGMRRLGDLRLECQVGIALAKKEINFLLIAAMNTFFLTSNWCMTDKLNFPTYSARPVTGATMINGGLRKELTVFKDGHGYEAPINDKNYTNDALIELHFAPASISGS